MDKILLCFTLPHGIDIQDTIAWKSFSKIEQMVNLKHVIIKGASICINRNRCIIGHGLELIKQENLVADRFIFIDYDISFSLEDIQLLLKSGKDIIGGKYLTRSGKVCAGYWHEDYNGILGKDLDNSLKGINKVDWLGAGFLMVSKRALEDTEYPWFRPYIITHGNERSITSEDLGFCKHMSESGYESYVHCDVNIKHNKD